MGVGGVVGERFHSHRSLPEVQRSAGSKLWLWAAVLPMVVSFALGNEPSNCMHPRGACRSYSLLQSRLPYVTRRGS